MSRFKQRKETNCLNCGTIVQGRFCHNCGQENVEPKESFWHLVTHFVYDVTHFDGKFWSTAKYLLTKPGFLSKEYISGKRKAYLNPIRMYVFVSAFFFLWFFSVVKPDFNNSRRKKKAETQTLNADSTGRSRVKGTLAHAADSAEFRIKDSLEHVYNSAGDTARKTRIPISRNSTFTFDRPYKSRQEYDSVQKALSTAERDGWLKRKMVLRSIEINDEYSGKQMDFLQKVVEHFLHSFPQMLFISLPLVALLLRLLYVRRKQFYYVDHVIFLIHLYCAMFILMFLMMGIQKLDNITWLSWIGYLKVPLVIYGLWYVYKAMRSFYAQRRAKTILKLFLLFFTSSFIMLFLFLVFLVLSVFAV